MFGIDDKYVDNALKNGFLHKKEDGSYEQVQGFIMLMFIKELNQYCLCYGTGTENSGFVFVKDFKTTWDVITNE